MLHEITIGIKEVRQSPHNKTFNQGDLVCKKIQGGAITRLRVKL